MSHVLELIKDEDAESLHGLFSTIGMANNLEATKAFIRHLNSDNVKGRKLVVDGVLVAGGQLTIQKFPHVAEVGFWVHGNHQRRGFGYATAIQLVTLGFTDLKLHRIFGKTFTSNVASMRTLEKVGMRKEGELRDAGIKDGKYYHEVYYGILQYEWT
jgi:RimJ/RimL family protein N-acetyltransferase